MRFGLLTTLLFAVICSNISAATLRVENLVRIKGQEQTMIRGYGIVSGLNGTGDDPKSYGPSARAISRMLELSGLPSGKETELAKKLDIGTSKNNALVEVTVTIPATGGRDGDLLDCTVKSVGNAKSLEGGDLSATILISPIPVNLENEEPRGLAWGPLTIEKEIAKNVAKIKRGCRLTGNFVNPYILDGTITLVLNREYAMPRMARTIAEKINNDVGKKIGNQEIARAPHQNYVTVKMRDVDFADPLPFLADLMDVEINLDRPIIPRVVINERVGIISIDEGVEVKPIVLTHKNIVAEIRPPVQPPGQEINPQQFVDVDTEMKYRQFMGEAIVNQKLKALQASLDTVRIPPADMIEIIKILERQGAIIGEVIYVE